jgi:hypothetical protein
VPNHSIGKVAVDVAFKRWYIPLAGTAVEIRNGDRITGLRTDAEGYSVIALPAGDYELNLQGVGRKVRVETGKTNFVMIRTGKRMVD